MKPNQTHETKPAWIWPVAGCVFILLLAMLIRSATTEPATGPSHPARSSNATDWHATVSRLESAQPHQGHRARTAAEIAAAKLKKFSAKRRALVGQLAARYKISVLPKVKQFFDTLDAGDWDETKRLFNSLRADLDGPSGDDLHKYWRAIVEAYGAAEQVQLWPAQQLLDYGNGILDSLKPGMVYVGGTDAGCFICTMLNETTDGEQHITLTQNALADSSYLAYLTAIYGDSLNVPTQEDSANAFNQYVADVTARQQHDEQFPDEPPQVLPGENVTFTDGRPNVSGVTSVMGVNNIFMQDLLQENPDLSFGMQESFPLSSSYAGAIPLGPIFELRSGDAMTSDMADQAVNYWQGEAQSLQAGDETSSPVLTSYSHNAAADGNMLANNAYPVEAGQAYQTALSIWPGNVAAITGLTQVLAQQGQFDQAGQALNSFLQNNPQQSQTVANLRQNWLAGH